MGAVALSDPGGRVYSHEFRRYFALPWHPVCVVNFAGQNGHNGGRAGSRKCEMHVWLSVSESQAECYETSCQYAIDRKMLKKKKQAASSDLLLNISSLACQV